MMTDNVNVSCCLPTNVQAFTFDVDFMGLRQSLSDQRSVVDLKPLLGTTPKINSFHTPANFSNSLGKWPLS